MPQDTDTQRVLDFTSQWLTSHVRFARCVTDKGLSVHEATDDCVSDGVTHMDFPV